MNDDKSLYQAVGKAQEDIEKLNEKSRGREPRKDSPAMSPRVRLAILGLVAFGLIVTDILYSTRLDRELQEDYRLAALDLIMEADADIYSYYQANQNLPVTFSKPWLETEVRYQKLDNTRFQLQLRYGPYLQVIDRDVHNVISPSEVLSLL